MIQKVSYERTGLFEKLLLALSPRREALAVRRASCCIEVIAFRTHFNDQSRFSLSLAIARRFTGFLGLILSVLGAYANA